MCCAAKPKPHLQTPCPSLSLTLLLAAATGIHIAQADEEGRVAVHFSRRHAGTYEAIVHMGPTRLMPPLTCEVRPATASPQHSFADGAGLDEAVSGREARFTVVTHDAHGNRRMKGGDALSAYLALRDPMAGTRKRQCSVQQPKPQPSSQAAPLTTPSCPCHHTTPHRHAQLRHLLLVRPCRRRRLRRACGGACEREGGCEGGDAPISTYRTHRDR